MTIHTPIIGTRMPITVERKPIDTGNLPSSVAEWIHQGFGTVHSIMLDDEPWFIGREIADILKYVNPWDALKKHVDRLDKKRLSRKTALNQVPRDWLNLWSVTSMGGTQSLVLINESGLYSLIIRSRLKSAKQFQRWITREVLPSIRKHGAYMTPETLNQVQSDPSELQKLVESLEKENRQLHEENCRLKPGSDYTHKVLQADESVPFTLVAKEYGMTAHALHKLLHRLHIIFRFGKRWYPYSKFANLGWFTNHTHLYQTHSGKTGASTNLYITQLGRHQLYLILQNHGINPAIDSALTS